MGAAIKKDKVETLIGRGCQVADVQVRRWKEEWKQHASVMSSRPAQLVLKKDLGVHKTRGMR